MKRKLAFMLPALGLIALGLVSLAPSHAANPGARIEVTGEIVDSWCQISGIMEAEGSAHHQCAVFCLSGGIPVGLLTEDKKIYVLLAAGGETAQGAAPRWIDLATHHVKVSADLIERDGVAYLLVDRVITDHGLVNVNHVGKTLWPFGEEP